MSPELEKSAGEIRRLEAINAAVFAAHASLEPRESLQSLVAEAVRLTRASSGSLVLRNPNSNMLEIEAALGLPRLAAGLRLPMGKGVTGWVAVHGQVARVGDVRKDPRYFMVRPEARSELAAPLIADGEVRGVLNVDSEEVDAFSEADERVLTEFARHAVVVIRNSWLFEQAQRRNTLSAALTEVARLMNTTLAPDEVLQVITREAVKLTGAKLSSVLMAGGDPEWLEVRASHGAGPDYLGRGRVSVAESLVGVVMRRRKPLVVEDVRSSRLYQSTEVARREGLVSLLSVPLIIGGTPFGALNVYLGEPHTFSNEEIHALSALADLAAMALERARLAEQMARAEEQLRQSDKLCALGLLAAEVAHEIRNPLTVMKMLYHSLDLRFPEDDPRGEDARVIGEKMDLLNRIVEQILGFARHAEPRFGKVSVPTLLEDLRLLTRHKLRAHRVEWQAAIDPACPDILGDATQLEQAFLNLILNATQAMPEGGTLTISCRPEGEPPARTLVVTVADTGVGFEAPPDPGRSGILLNSTKPQGTGLGLAIVTRVVEAHRGRIRFESAPGKGTTVILELPAGE